MRAALGAHLRVKATWRILRGLFHRCELRMSRNLVVDATSAGWGDAELTAV